MVAEAEPAAKRFFGTERGGSELKVAKRICCKRRSQKVLLHEQRNGTDDEAYRRRWSHCMVYLVYLLYNSRSCALLRLSCACACAIADLCHI